MKYEDLQTDDLKETARQHDINLDYLLYRMGFAPQHVVEVGGHSWLALICRRLIEEGKCPRIEIFEGSKVLCDHLLTSIQLANATNVTVINAVFGFKREKGIFWETGTQSSSIVQKFKGDCKQTPVTYSLFSDYDDGTIDMMILDIEWAELCVLQHMKSRPKVISCEICDRNPSAPDILGWFKANKYRKMGQFDSDFIFVKT